MGELAWVEEQLSFRLASQWVFLLVWVGQTLQLLEQERSALELALVQVQEQAVRVEQQGLFLALQEEVEVLCGLVA